MSLPKLYRRRFNPDELICLKDDIILLMEERLIITKWNTLNPRKDIARGISAYYLDKGYKVSKVYDHNDRLVYWYCDIIQVKTENDSIGDLDKSLSGDDKLFIFEDLLLDVILYEDGTVRVMDLDELADALTQGLITQEEATYALRTLNTLLALIYDGQFHTLTSLIEKAEGN